MKCFHHNDADGYVSAMCVKKFAPRDGYKEEYIEITYGDQFPFNSIATDEIVYIVDYSIQPDEMHRLLMCTGNVVWIDHHKTAIDKYKDFNVDIAGIRQDGVAGCMLTWQYFNELPEDEAPKFIRLVADYDVWTFKYGEDTKNFHTGFDFKRAFSTDDYWWHIAESPCWDESVDNIIVRGKTMNEYRDNIAETYCKSFGFETVFAGHKAFAMNQGMVSSDHFKSVDEDKYDLFIAFVFNGVNWQYSLRSSKTDVSDIAKKYGGGGHKGAAGFSSDNLLLKKTWFLN